MSNNNLLYILTMLECIEKCKIYTQNFASASEFMWANDQREFNAVISLFIAIGEESKKIDIKLKQQSDNSLDWASIAGIRDKISHNYRGTNPDILWNIIHKDLPKLKDSLLQILNTLSPSQELLAEFLNSPYYKHLYYLKK